MSGRMSALAGLAKRHGDTRGLGPARAAEESRPQGNWREHGGKSYPEARNEGTFMNSRMMGETGNSRNSRLPPNAGMSGNSRMPPSDRMHGASRMPPDSRMLDDLRLSLDVGLRGDYRMSSDARMYDRDSRMPSDMRMPGDSRMSFDSGMFGDTGMPPDASRMVGDSAGPPDARMYGNSRLPPDARMHGDSRIPPDTRLHGNSRIPPDARMYGDSRMPPDARMHGASRMPPDDRMYGDSRVPPVARMYGDERMPPDPRMQEDASMLDNLRMYSNSRTQMHAGDDDEVIDYNHKPPTLNVSSGRELDPPAQSRSNPYPGMEQMRISYPAQVVDHQRPAISSSSFNTGKNVDQAKQGIDFLLNTVKGYGLIGREHNSSGRMATLSLPSNMPQTEEVGKAFGNQGGQRDKSAKAFDYLKSWRLKMNMPTDSFNLERDVTALERENGPPNTASYPHSQRDSSMMQKTNSSGIMNRSGDTRDWNASSNSYDKRLVVGERFEERLPRDSSRLESQSQNFEGGSAGFQERRHWKDMPNNQMFNQKRNYDSSGFGQSLQMGHDFSGPQPDVVNAKRQKLSPTYMQYRENMTSVEGRPQSRTPVCDEIVDFKAQASNSVYDKSRNSPLDWKRSPAFDRKHSPGAGRMRSFETVNHNRPGREMSPLGFPQQHRGKQPHFEGRSPGPSGRGRSPGPSGRGRSPGPLLRGRSPGPLLRGRSPGPLLRGRSPGPLLRGRSLDSVARGRSLSPLPKGRSPAQFSRGRSPHPHSRGRSPRPISRGRSPHSLSRGRSPLTHSRGRSPLPRGRSPHPRGRSPHPRGRSPHPRGRSPIPRGRSSHSLSRGRSPDRLHRGRSLSPQGRERSPVPSDWKRSPGSYGRGRSPAFYPRGRSPVPRTKDRSPGPRGRSPGFSGRGRSPKHLGRSRHELVSTRSPPSRNHRRSPGSYGRGRSPVNYDHLNRIGPELGERSPLLDEVSQSPREGRYNSPCRRRRNSLSPGGLQHGLSPISALSADRGSFHDSQRDLHRSSYQAEREDEERHYLSHLERGCSPVSLDGGFIREEKHHTQGKASISSHRHRESGDKRERFSNQTKKKFHSDEPVSQKEMRKTTEHAQKISKKKSSDAGKSSMDETTEAIAKSKTEQEEGDEDLRVHLLRLREQKVEQKLKKLEEESRETEIKLRSSYRDNSYWDEDTEVLTDNSCDEVEYPEVRRDWAHQRSLSPRRHRERSPRKRSARDRIRY